MSVVPSDISQPICENKARVDATRFHDRYYSRLLFAWYDVRHTIETINQNKDQYVDFTVDKKKASQLFNSMSEDGKKLSDEIKTYVARLDQLYKLSFDRVNFCNKE